MRQTSATDRDYSVLNFRQFKGECLKGSILTRGYHKYSLAYAVNLNNYVRSNTDNVFGEGVFFVCAPSEVHVKPGLIIFDDFKMKVYEFLIFCHVNFCGVNSALCQESCGCTVPYPNSQAEFYT